MSFAQEFAKRINHYLKQGIESIRETTKQEHSLESLNFILLYKPLLQAFRDFIPQDKWAKGYNEVISLLSGEGVKGRLAQELEHLLKQASVGKKYFEEYSLEELTELIYTKQLNKVINFIYDTLCFQREIKNQYRNYQWL